jgi:hypothetical protein
LPIGGLLSGFFGGLSGHQGAFRSAFLIKAGLDKVSFVATGVIIASMVDITRIITYTGTVLTIQNWSNEYLLLYATISAFLGAYLGRKLLKKVTMRQVQNIVSGMLLLVAILLGFGLI